MQEKRTIREISEEREQELFSPHASLSIHAERDNPEVPCDVRTDYQRDRDRIIHCKSFRRLKDKTQVFLVAEGDHYRNRLTHTLEVAQLSRTVAKALRVNEELTEAISYAHDLGHTPFGHIGEDALNAQMRNFGLSFSHAEQGVRVVEKLENDGRGLNLTKAVRDGIRNHGTGGHPSTWEGKIVRLCDKVAYLNHDIDDAIRAGILTEEDVPSEYRSVLGQTVKERLDHLIKDLIFHSLETGEVGMSPETLEAMYGLRSFMFGAVYLSPMVRREGDKAADVVRALYGYYLEHPDQMGPECRRSLERGGERPEVVTCDYIAGMTDHYAIARYEELFVPQAWRL
ncbi:MAG: deoxyguanosinetriphosphate triphosphohydrolase [Lachnospiraceae bacterium]|nr:deoxyguanosinetriphosphate triphosphohydrolase [Lachnospiraceae bacterium]